MFSSSIYLQQLKLDFSNKHLDADYDFLPAQDSSFEQNSIDEFNISVSNKNFYIGLEKYRCYHARNNFPKNVDVDVDEEIIFGLFY